MAQYVSPPPLRQQQQQQEQFQFQRSFPSAPRLSVGGPPFINVFDPQINNVKLPRPREAKERNVRFLPPFVALLLSSTYFLIALCILLIVPILQLAIGLAYRTQCRVNPNIPVYLIVTGACGIGSVGLTIVIVLAFVCCLKENSLSGSFVTGCIVTLAVCLILLTNFFLFIWFIVGNVWVFGAKNKVDFKNVRSNNYCHPVLYQFAFWIIILTYIMVVVSCCVSCCRACLQSVKAIKA